MGIPSSDPERVYDSQGYVWLVWKLDDRTVRAREHRVVTRAPLGSHVHHINGVRDDNRPENLVVMDARAHQMEHVRLGRNDKKLVEKQCVICGDRFQPRSSLSTTCRSVECVTEHHKRSAKLANQKRWEGKKIMTPEERKEKDRIHKANYKKKMRDQKYGKHAD